MLGSNDDGTWRSDIFYNTLNTQFVPIALNAARGADANAKLYINDYNIESPGAKATSIVNLVKSLQSAGTPIDGIGFQCHFIVGEVPTSTVTVMNQITALGLEVSHHFQTLFSEAHLDFSERSPSLSLISACQHLQAHRTRVNRLRITAPLSRTVHQSRSASVSLCGTLRTNTLGYQTPSLARAMLASGTRCVIISSMENATLICPSEFAKEAGSLQRRHRRFLIFCFRIS